MIIVILPHRVVVVIVVKLSDWFAVVIAVKLPDRVVLVIVVKLHIWEVVVYQ